MGQIIAQIIMDITNASIGLGKGIKQGRTAKGEWKNSKWLQANQPAIQEVQKQASGISDIVSRGTTFNPLNQNRSRNLLF